MSSEVCEGNGPPRRAVQVEPGQMPGARVTLKLYAEGAGLEPEPTLRLVASIVTRASRLETSTLRAPDSELRERSLVARRMSQDLLLSLNQGVASEP
jgi:hypothetical protein